MNPVQISDTLKQTLVSYLTTTFDVNRHGEEPELAQEMERQFTQDGALVKGPFLESAPPYRTGASLQDLNREGIVSERLLALPSFRQGRPIPLNAPLYVHQERAIRKLLEEERSIVVASGTGSGKSESFLLPILDDLLRTPRKGVRAVLIYPLNALVNDQLDRLRTLLGGTSITFGRYTSELAQEDAAARRRSSIEHPENEILGRDVIRSGERLPNILITNYAMLEYLLLRPQDTALFEHKDDWRYIVLDEAHSYSGAQGIEVAMLIRRLKHKLGKAPGEMLCVATSATLSDKVEVAASFATTLFGEDVTTDDIIIGDVDSTLAMDFEGGYEPEPQGYLNASIEALLYGMSDETSSDAVKHELKLAGLLDSDTAAASGLTGAQTLYDAMRRNEHLRQLRLKLQDGLEQPLALNQAGLDIFPMMHPQDRVLAVSRLIELGATARSAPDAAPLFPARYHMFARGPQGVWVCVNPHCPDKKSDTLGWSRLFTVKRETCDICNCVVFPLLVCRECGQVLLSNKVDNRDNEDDRIVFHWRTFEPNIALNTDAEESDELPETSEEASASLFDHQPLMMCLSCGKFAEKCDCSGTGHRVELQRIFRQKTKGKQKKHEPLNTLQECPRCYAKAFGDSDIVTPVSIGGGSPLSIMTEELYRQLAPSSDTKVREQPGEGRKLLTFYDSRQGAARFAAMLQDSVNGTTYRNIVAMAVRDLNIEEKSYAPDLAKLRDRILQIVIENRLYHNDGDLFEFDRELWRKGSLGRNERDRLQTYITTRLLGEFTTFRDRRGSMERLGILTVAYLEEAERWKELAQRIGFPVDVAQGLAETLLDRIRKSKIVTLPKGVDEKDELFGRNKTHRTVVLSQGGGQRDAWIGVTDRHRNIQLVDRLLRHFQLEHSIHANEVLRLIWEWLCDDAGILEKVGNSPAERRLSHAKLFFTPGNRLFVCSKCKATSTRFTSVCIRASCDGTQQAVLASDALVDNFYYKSAARQPIPLRVEEHTAQLSPERGRIYQEEFKAGLINLLSCSTTFEMGIDLGDLNAVVMSNVPPLVSNYRQRSGRAGRRANGTAFILTWANDRPHDQHYFRNPPDIIRGAVRTPYIQLGNVPIRQRHVNSLLLGKFLLYLAQVGQAVLLKAGAFFDRTGAQPAPHVDQLQPWIEANRTAIEDELRRFAQRWLGVEINSNGWLDVFLQDMESAATRFNASAEYYRDQREKALAALSNGATGAHREEALQAEGQMYRLLSRLRDEELTEHLPKRGVLPSYSFPLYSVELLLPAEYSEKKELRLERDLRQAIREFAPGSEVVADKRIWKSGALTFYKQGVRGRFYRVCKNCRNLELGADDGIELLNESGRCAVCKELLERAHQFVTPDAFRADKKGSGAIARAIVHTLPSVMQGAMVIPETNSGEEEIGSIVRASNQIQGNLLFVNEGSRGRKFKICLTCGNPRYKGDCPFCQDGGYIRSVSLGHTRDTNILRLRFVGTDDFIVPPAENSSFWLSLMYALIYGASRGLQIERRDLNGLLAPRGMEDGSWTQTIVLYDDVPGGAGHTEQIRKNMRAVLQEALRVAECTDCSEETSCYHCLQDYSNQDEHQHLVRGPVVDFLRRVLDDLNEDVSLVPGARRVVAGDLRAWLMRRIARTRVRVDLALSAVVPPERALLTDLLGDMLKRDIQVALYLEKQPGIDPEDLLIRKSLQGLMVDGLHLYSIDAHPYWSVILDAEHTESAEVYHIETRRAGGEFNDISELLRGEQPNLIVKAKNELAAANPAAIQIEMLDIPPDTQLIIIDEHSRTTTSEEALFGDVFAMPVVDLIINDPYLFDRHRIVNRLGAYVRLAHKGGRLNTVKVYTRRANNDGANSWAVQKAAEEMLEREFPNVISFHHTSPEHDRSIRLIHDDGTETLIVIGRGLDFIQPNGRARSTFITVKRTGRP